MNTAFQSLSWKKGRARVQNCLNREGAPSFRRSLKEQLLAVLSTGTFGETFYASGKQLAEEAREVITEAREACPEFLSRALVWAREEGMMKTVPVTGLAILSAGGGRTKDLFQQTFPRVVKTPDDLRAFVGLAKSGVIPGRKGLGGMTVEPVRDFCANVSEYHALKYGSANSKEVTLRDIIRMAHPKPATPEIAERLGWLVRGNKVLGENQALNSRIRKFESLKKATTETEVISLIREGGLPFEVVVPSLKKTTTAIWSEILKQAPYMNLLRNLETFTRHEVFVSEENVQYAVSRLTDPNAIQRSRVLPFRFFNAWKVYSQNPKADSRIADALRSALNLSFANMPSLGNRTIAIGPDVSMSMQQGATTSSESSSRCIDIAGIFTGALMKRIEGRAIPLPFDTSIHANDLSSRDDLMVAADKVASYGGGGTAVGAPMKYLFDRKIKVDVFIGITDNEDWADCDGDGYRVNGNFLAEWRRYRKEINPKAQAFLLTIAPYCDAVASRGEKGVHFIYGWSDRVLNYIALKLNSGASQVEQIERMDLNPGGAL